MQKTLIQLFTALALAVASVTAAAAVALVHTVEKIERTIAEDGTVTVTHVAADPVIPGDELRYTITFSNDGDAPVDAGSIVITNPLPAEVTYLAGTAFGAGTQITFSVDGVTFDAPEKLKVTVEGVDVIAPADAYTAIRWQFAPELAVGAKSFVSFNARLK